MSGDLILVVDDEPSVTEVVSLYLAREGFRVATASDGPAALEAVARQRPALIVLDLMLPGVDGLEITRRLRADGNLPIILLTARSLETDRILGLELGADDYVVKPFSPQELVARVKAVLRRAAPQPGEAERPVVFGDLHIDPVTRTVVAAARSRELTAKEFDLLLFLARHPRQVFTRTQLLENVWGFSEFVDASTVTVHIRRLREKIEADPAHPQMLQTVWGVGYKFEPPV
ncbi:MAG: response regulator transcription factor [Chloroflexi bacterium]|nr:response regulator transcription factor [Chloroflexota bacterium]MBI3760957.1 response regulator transcription factor [Chloroflexota bacterium]